MIVKDSRGNELLEIIKISEEAAMQQYAPVNHALLVVKLGDEYLMGWNRWRQDWEIFGGCMEEGETLRECIIREAWEELGLQNVEYTWLGLMHDKMAPGYFNPEWHEEYGGLYGVTLPKEMLAEIEKHREDREEIEKLAMYSQIKEKCVAPIDEKLLEYWK
ncbi:MAG: NUDIX domain-containing protein [Lachnospiraceae bacterium]|nr:NUDIX domain-containing protein [Lachnospiraceae bacterium]